MLLFFFSHFCHPHWLPGFRPGIDPCYSLSVVRSNRIHCFLFSGSPFSVSLNKLACLFSAFCGILNRSFSVFHFTWGADWPTGTPGHFPVGPCPTKKFWLQSTNTILLQSFARKLTHASAFSNLLLAYQYLLTLSFSQVSWANLR
jgi:hypothetical protein